MRWLVWLVLGLLVYLAVRSRAKTLQENFRNSARAEFDAQAGASAQPAAKPSSPIENMVACSYCQLYLPASEAISANDHYFCCEEHAQYYSNASSKPAA
ncbi:PP0621 family protein [Solimicrobium silvestre]|uniref:Uncharacterized protein n=1 Tax=Solimicrobium silvestre TaxID=2099400 RepID=A0A2S9GUJ9_9BURK|nr:PP0621 family protein [Solimicrobium silvestre]PRC91381.1 hypothetical protein S2091_3926 [Solimicrobium silvestre]